MKNIFTAILCCLLFIALSTLAATKQTLQTPDNAPATSDISTDLKLQQQKLEFFKERLDSQDKRIGDLAFYLSLSLACFGVLMTVIVVFFSFRSTKEAVLSAKEEARKEVEAQAKIIIETWLSKEGQPLLVKKVEDTLRPEVDKALGDIRNAAGGVLSGLEEEQRIAHDHNTKHGQLCEQYEKVLSELSARTVDKAQPLSDEQKKTVDEMVKELESKPPKEYRFEDWFMLGIQAFESEKYETAADQFSKAAEAATESVDQAKALLSKGITLGQMQRNEEEIAVYDEVLRRYGEATETALRERVAKALLNKGFTLGQMQRNEEEIAVYDEVLRRYGEAAETALREPVAKALLNKGVTLGQMQRNKEAIAVYDEVLRRYGEAAETALRELVANALVNKGITLGQMQRNEEAIAACNEVVRRYGEAAETALREQVVNALVNKGAALSQMQRNEEAIAACNEVVRRYGDEAEMALRAQVAKALVNKGVSLGQMQRNEEAIAVSDEVLRCYGEAMETALREPVAKALVNKGVSLGRMQRNEEKIAVYDEVLRRYGEAAETALRELVANALVNKGVTLGQMQRNEEAIAAYDEVVLRYGEATETALREQVARARNGLGFVLLCKAKKSWNDGDETFATELLTQALSKIEAALKDKPDEPIYLGNQAYILFLLGRREEAQPILARAISLGGEELRQGKLKDAGIHTLPQDEAFKELILGLQVQKPANRG
ncbi:MAG: tetratricopeptide repeat protein [Gallionella sp.]|nr:tetratricopeptide repeat protein [Gallionella sp.]